MTDDLDQAGPIDYLVVEFPGNKMTGEAFPILVDLADRGIIRILDLVFLRKELDGSVVGMAIADFDQDGELDLAVFEGASSGLLDDSDIDEAGAVLEPGSSAGVLVYENTWAGAVRQRPPAVRWPAGRQRPDPRPGHPRGPGRRRAGQLTGPPREEKVGNHAGSAQRRRTNRRHRGDSDPRIQQRVAAPGRPVG